MREAILDTRQVQARVSIVSLRGLQCCHVIWGCFIFVAAEQCSPPGGESKDVAK